MHKLLDLKRRHEEHEAGAETQRYKRGWVQHNRLTDRIAETTRLTSAMVTSVNTTSNSFLQNQVLQPKLCTSLKTTLFH